MFDIGGFEFLLIAMLGIIIIGPKELPAAIRNVTSWIRKARNLAREFQSGLDDIVRETELDKIKDEVSAGLDPSGTLGSLKDEISGSIDPDGEIEDAFSMDDTDDWYSDHEDGEEGEDTEKENVIAAPGLAEPALEDDPALEGGEAEDEESGVPRADAGGRA